MGQQQLLLIALSVLIVGAAVAVGVNMFNQGAAQADTDRFYQRAATLATEFAKWYKKPVTMGGAGGSLPDNLPDEANFAAILGIEDDDANTEGMYLDGAPTSVSSGITLDNGDTDGEGILIKITGPTGTATFVATEEGRALWDHENSVRPGTTT